MENMPDMIKIGYARSVSSVTTGSVENTITILLKGKEPGIYYSFSPSGGILTSVGSATELNVGFRKFIGDPNNMDAGVFSGWSGSLSGKLGVTEFLKADINVGSDVRFDDKGNPSSIWLKGGVSVGVDVSAIPVFEGSATGGYTPVVRKIVRF